VAAPVRVSVLVEPLLPLLQRREAGQRLPALETLISRADYRTHAIRDPDELRFHLFGVETTDPLPIGALTCFSDRNGEADGSKYYLRADPVTLWADMARLIMTSYGFADLDELERNEIENTIRKVLKREGLVFGSEHPERWTIPLQRPLDFKFAPIQKAVGIDVGEVLPDGSEARHWCHIMNEIQVALHACPANIRRRRLGMQEINSVWFWGQGYLPEAASSRHFDAVFSSQPVSRGLALVHESRLYALSECFDTEFPEPGDTRILIDWTPPRTEPAMQLLQLEWFAGQLLQKVKQTGLVVDLYSGDGKSWTYSRPCGLRFWRRRRLPGHARSEVGVP